MVERWHNCRFVKEVEFLTGVVSSLKSAYNFNIDLNVKYSKCRPAPSTQLSSTFYTPGDDSSLFPLARQG